MTLVGVANGNNDVQHNDVLWPLQNFSFHYNFLQYIGLQKTKTKLHGPGNSENEDLYLSRVGSG